MDAFIKDVLNVEASSLCKMHPMDAFQQRLFNSQRETYFLLKPKTNAFHIKDVVHWTFFVWNNCPQNGCLYERCSQCEAVLKQNAPEMDAFFLKPIFCWNLMPPKPMPFMSQNAPKIDAFMKDVLNVKPVLLNAPEMDAFQQRLC